MAAGAGDCNADCKAIDRAATDCIDDSTEINLQPGPDAALEPSRYTDDSAGRYPEEDEDAYPLSRC